MNQRTPGLVRNAISLIGAALVLVSLVNIVFLFLADIFGVRAKPYLGIFAYMVFPAILIVGLLVIPVGMLLERRRRRKMAPSEVSPYPKIDLNDPRHRGAFAFFMGFTLLFLLLSTVGSYRAYEFTDSITFCGELCHTVMKPEFTAYQASPHARVACVDCHVGPGATWYVRSKLSGVYQVYAVLFDKYPRPIPTPIESLRPAQETCEQCHWPEKFFGAQLKVITHYAPDEKNTPRQIRMLIKTGGGSPTTGLTTGIHWHMNIANEVWYIATDEKRQTIPWVRMKDKQGRVTEYLAKDATVKPEEIEKAPKRRMDCVDCHNRPTHIYVPPDRAVDEAFLAGRLDRSLPLLKQQAIEVLTKSYPSTDAAMEGIATALDAFYLTKDPDLYAKKQEAIKEAIAEIQRIFKTNMFPEMQVDWRTHPDNIGHFYFPGCFRCHDGQHVSREGKVIRKDCEICHTILGQEEGGAPMVAVKGGAFRHPIELGDLAEVTCSDCHTGGVGP
ncbi:MAG: NapC/NirT family cytochrome c [candidate division NC10 bacterium]|nr:NapC/NirT family cytochrome c [candidate division NC10 bacterium]